MKWNKSNVDPMGTKPKFESKEEEIEWMNAVIEVCSNYPDQSMQLLAASLIWQRNKLKEELTSCENG